MEPPKIAFEHPPVSFHYGREGKREGDEMGAFFEIPVKNGSCPVGFSFTPPPSKRKNYLESA